MMLFLEFALLFCVGSVCGWVMELIYRRVSHGPDENGRWINPGFLVGPCLPLYGLCLVMGFSISEFITPKMPGGMIGKVLAFIIIALFITIIEYITGIIFIKNMKIKLWDYTNEWGNISGIICPKFSLIWTLLAGIYYFFIHAHIVGILSWFAKNLAFSFVLGLFYGIFILDLVYSFRLVRKIRTFAKDTHITVHYDEFRSNMNEIRLLKQSKPQFFFSLRSDIPLSEALKDYALKLKKLENEDFAKEKFDEYRKKMKTYNEAKLKLQKETMDDIFRGVRDIERNIGEEIKKQKKIKK